MTFCFRRYIFVSIVNIVLLLTEIFAISAMKFCPYEDDFLSSSLSSASRPCFVTHTKSGVSTMFILAVIFLTPFSKLQFNFKFSYLNFLYHTQLFFRFPTLAGRYIFEFTLPLLMIRMLKLTLLFIFFSSLAEWMWSRCRIKGVGGWKLGTLLSFNG
jgi:hypothetical protein